MDVETLLDGLNDRQRDTVAAPLEQQINGVEGMIYQLSNSASSGAMSLTAYFQVGTDPDQARAASERCIAAYLGSDENE